VSDTLGRKDGFQPIAPVDVNGLTFGFDQTNGIIKVFESKDTDLEGGGKIAVGTTAVGVAFTATPNSIVLSAANDNVGTLYIGKSNVATDGSNSITYLDAGEKLVLTYDDTTNPIYIVASQAAQNFFKGALF
jgi:hypothetical protein